ncbi:MAG: DUF1667 domain-containing protein [Clostridia bacterium]
MKTTMTCISCPNGCSLEVEQLDNGEIIVKGNKCPRGIAFAEKELTAPTRSLTSTVATIFKQMPVVSVRTDGEIPKGQMLELMKIINSITVDKPLKVGTVVAVNVLDSGVNLIITTDMTRIIK